VAFRLCIIVAEASAATSLSVALKRPERSFRAATDSSASNFTEWSMRVYISVICMLAWPSHRETFRKSFVACKTVSAQVCLRTCGDPTRADAILDRLVHNAHRLTLAGESMRKRRNGLTSKEVSE
jgi:IstB-like ATP binding protein